MAETNKPISLNYSKWMVMKTKLATLLILLTLFAIPAVADDVDKWIQDLKDPNPSVREAAAENLSNLGNTRAVGPLIKSLSDTDSGVRGTAAYALSKMNDTRTVDQLILALGNTDSHDSLWNNLINLLPFIILSILFFGELMIVYKKNWYPDKCIRWTGLTLIIVVASYLATVSTNNGTALTAVIGLLGTIAGYLVGTSQSEKTKGTFTTTTQGTSSSNIISPTPSTPVTPPIGSSSSGSAAPSMTSAGIPVCSPSTPSPEYVEDEAGMEIPKS
jgi:hypothetical protein